MRLRYPAPSLRKCILSAGAVLLSACSRYRPNEVRAPASGDLPAFVSGEAAQALSGNGEFPRTGEGKSGRVEIVEADASRMAIRWVQQFASWIVPSFEAARRGSIHLDQLRPCGRNFYVQSAYGNQAATAPEIVRRMIGPHWLIPFCQGGENAMTIAVSAFATMTAATGAADPDPSGADIFPYPAPVGGRIPWYPEDAAREVASRTGRRVTRVPDLVGVGYGWSPQSAVWRIVLDAPIQVRLHSGLTQSATELFVRGGTSLLYFASAGSTTQGAQETVSTSFGGEATLTRRGDLFSRLAPVTLEVR